MKFIDDILLDFQKSQICKSDFNSSQFSNVRFLKASKHWQFSDFRIRFDPFQSDSIQSDSIRSDSIRFKSDSIQSDSIRFGPIQCIRSDSIRSDSMHAVRFGPIRSDSIRFWSDSVWSDSIRSDSMHSDRFNSVRFNAFGPIQSDSICFGPIQCVRSDSIRLNQSVRFNPFNCLSLHFHERSSKCLFENVQCLASNLNSDL